MLVAASSAFVPPTARQNRPSLVRVQAHDEPSFDPLGLSAEQQKPSRAGAAAAFAAAAAALTAQPLAAIAEEADDYEYGAVDAPIGIAVVGGLLAVGTALLPVVMSSGEEAFEEMKERDSDKWGR